MLENSGKKKPRKVDVIASLRNLLFRLLGMFQVRFTLLCGTHHYFPRFLLGPLFLMLFTKILIF